MLHMIQKCSIIRVLGIFFEEPTQLHFIREISKKINLAPTSVIKYINEFEKEGLIIKKESKPFRGYIANRDNEDFIFYKRVYNFNSLNELKKYISKEGSPKLLVVFGSYALGEDIEESDIDLLIVTKGEKHFNFEKFEKSLKREINPIILEEIEELDKNLKNQVHNGFILFGSF